MKINRAFVIAFTAPAVLAFVTNVSAAAAPDAGSNASASFSPGESGTDSYSNAYLASHPAGSVASQQDAFGLFLTDLDNRFPHDVIDRWWDEGGGTVLVCPQAVASVERLAAAVAAPIVVEASASNALDSSEVMEAERSALEASRQAGLDAVETSYDRRSRVVTVSLAPDIQATATRPQLDRATLERVASRMAYSPEIVFRYADSISVTTAAI